MGKQMMKYKHYFTRHVILFTQLILLSGCGLLGNNPENVAPKTSNSADNNGNVSTDISQQCLDGLIKGISDYEKKIGKLQSGGSISESSIARQSENLSKDLKAIANLTICSNVNSNSLKEIINDIKGLDNLVSLMSDTVKNKKEIESALGDKVKLEPSEISKSDQETLETKFIKHTNEKISEILGTLNNLVKAPVRLTDNQVKRLEEQVKVLQITVRSLREELGKNANNDSETSQNLNNFKSFANTMILGLTATVALFGYILFKKYNSSSDLSVNKPATKHKQQEKNTSLEPNDVPSLSKKRLGGEHNTSTHNKKTNDQYLGKSKSYLGNIERELKNDRDNSKPSTTDHHNIDLSGNYESDSDDSSNQTKAVSPKYLPAYPVEKMQTKQPLTYDLAIEYYQDGRYELIRPYTEGYYSATSESIMSNRAYWGNPLELEKFPDGLFWIVKTIEPYLVLFPNPTKKIEDNRIRSIEYFFESNFSNVNYRNLIVIAPAYMIIVSGRLVMQQKGQIEFTY
jgi:hypothetical protein